MRGSVLVVAFAVALAGAGTAAASHVDTRTFQKGCGFSEADWEDGVYDCQGSIPSIQAPGFVPAEDVDGWLGDDDRVIGIEGDGEAKAYPIKILNYHEIVNDEHPADGEPIVVSYCPLCGSSVVFDRTVDGRTLDFHVSGYLHKADLVMVDEQTHSLWPQILGTAADGELHGTNLQLVASSTVTWDAWRAEHPDTQVLERPRCDDGSTENRRSCSGAFQRNYERSPYGNYDEQRSVGISGDTREDVLGMHPKADVLGIQVDGQPVAVPTGPLSDEGVVHETVEGTPVAVAWFGDGAVAVRNPDERTFQLAEDAAIEDEDGNTYDLPDGTSDTAPDLEPIPGVTLFWFAWLDQHPDTLARTDEGLQAVDGYEPPRSTPAPGPVGALAAVLAALALTARSRGS